MMAVSAPPNPPSKRGSHRVARSAYSLAGLLVAVSNSRPIAGLLLTSSSAIATADARAASENALRITTHCSPAMSLCRSGSVTVDAVPKSPGCAPANTASARSSPTLTAKGSVAGSIRFLPMSRSALASSGRRAALLLCVGRRRPTGKTSVSTSGSRSPARRTPLWPTNPSQDSRVMLVGASLLWEEKTSTFLPSAARA